MENEPLFWIVLVIICAFIGYFVPNGITNVFGKLKEKNKKFQDDYDTIMDNERAEAEERKKKNQ